MLETLSVFIVFGGILGWILGYVVVAMSDHFFGDDT